jgi:hypothetical protein
MHAMIKASGGADQNGIFSIFIEPKDIGLANE